MNFSKTNQAFTLAEVLVTLGIIGVVAALTIPVLTQNYKKRVVETRLQKFYSTINQVINLAEIDYGLREDWYNLNNVDTDRNGNPVAGNTPRTKWVNKYIVPYIKGAAADEVSFEGITRPIIYFADGSALLCLHQTSLADWVYFTSNPYKCVGKKLEDVWLYGGCSFKFIYNPAAEKTGSYKYVTNSFDTYTFGWDGTNENLYSSCRSEGAYCATLIQHNSWKIPDDYPKRIR